ncbi:MAG TPA: Rossmann-like and DUF2520 domain-containing protein [Planctomycetota bacterium]|nr:Rossmann-like and DUF2520 domain-containing protein [Planctomycetota bacterium]
MGKGVELSIVGAGRCGRTLGRLARQAGWRIGAVTCRTLAHAKEAAAFIGAGRPSTKPEGAALTLIAVPDGEIEAVARALRMPRGGVAAHTCAAFGAEALRPLRPAGALHPLRSFVDAGKAAASFAGTPCAVDGDAAAMKRLLPFVRAIGGTPLRVKAGRKPLYHAGAVFASNYLVTVLEAGLRLLEEAGVKRAAALRALTQLAEGTLANVHAVGIPEALTGPIERGDAATLKRHVASILERSPLLYPLYALLGAQTAEMAATKGSLRGRGLEKVQSALLPPGVVR